MKLLSKSEIQKSRSTERRMDIEEGAKLARKIDTLRETAAGEETRLSKFREESLKKIRSEIEEKSAEKKSIEDDIERLRAIREKLQEPLDKEWELVKKMASDLEKKSNSLDLKELNLNKRDQEIILMKESLQKEKTKVSESRFIAALGLIKLSEKMKAADEMLKKANIERENADKYKEDCDKNLLEREAVIASKERDLAAQFENLVKKRKEHGIRERQLRDREATFIRNIERTNGKRIKR